MAQIDIFHLREFSRAAVEQGAVSFFILYGNLFEEDVLHGEADELASLRRRGPVLRHDDDHLGEVAVQAEGWGRKCRRRNRVAQSVSQRRGERDEGRVHKREVVCGRRVCGRRGTRWRIRTDPTTHVFRRNFNPGHVFCN